MTAAARRPGENPGPLPRSNVPSTEPTATATAQVPSWEPQPYPDPALRLHRLRMRGDLPGRIHRKGEPVAINPTRHWDGIPSRGVVIIGHASDEAQARTAPARASRPGSGIPSIAWSSAQGSGPPWCNIAPTRTYDLTGRMRTPLPKNPQGSIDYP